MFNPAAENILASSSGDYTIKLWDLEDGQAKLTLKHNDIVQSLSWSGDGSMIVTTCRDKKLRFWDVRQQKAAHEVAGHSGAKNSRVVWMGEHDRVATTGFSKMSDRQLGLWDLRNPGAPVGGDFTFLDSISGVCMPFWDDGCQMLYLAGKGDGNIRYYEYENDKFEPLSEHKSADPQRGIAFVPKRGVNTHANEVMRAFKTVNDAYIEPISFIVPRRSENFQDDIYPPTVGTKSGTTSEEWLGGKSAYPPKVSMEDLYEGTEPREITAGSVPKPTATKTAPEPVPAPAAAKKIVEEEQKPEPTPAMAREVPSMKQNQQSMSSMASKFADPEQDEDAEDDASSFEEIAKPAERSARQNTSATTSTAAPAPEPAFSGETLSSAKTTSLPVSELTNRTSPNTADGLTSKRKEALRTRIQEAGAALKTALDHLNGLQKELAELEL